jgi:tRNA(fMet)-specific endonuclease VapC
MWLENQPSVCQKVALYESELAIMIITVQELFNGWVGRLNDPSSASQQIMLYGKLSKVVAFLREVQVLDFDEVAEKSFRQMLSQYPQLRKNRLQKDMRIAAIAIANNAIVITHNHRTAPQQGL